MRHIIIRSFIWFALYIACGVGLAAENENSNDANLVDNTISDLVNTRVEEAEFVEYENARQSVTTDMYRIMYEISGYFTELERIRLLESQRDLLKAEIASGGDDTDDKKKTYK